MQGDRVNRKSKKADLDRSTGKGVGAMRKDELVVKFSDRDAFGHFCVRLTEEGVPFSLAGSQRVVILGAKQFSDIPDKVRGGLYTLKDMGLIEILPAVPPGKRKLPTPQEADRILEDLIKDF